jgi:hypothetical protein
VINHGLVRSTVKPEPKEIDAYSVWINTNIREIQVQNEEDDAHIEYEFNQVQYSKDEYIKMIDDKNTELEATITDTQLALVDVYEMII